MCVPLWGGGGGGGRGGVKMEAEAVILEMGISWGFQSVTWHDKSVDLLSYIVMGRMIHYTSDTL